MSTHTDYFGTVVTAFDIQEPHPLLEVEALSQVESWAATLETPLGWSDLRSARLVDRFSEFLLSTYRTSPGGRRMDLRAWQRLPDVHQCVEAARTTCAPRVTYVPGATTVSPTARKPGTGEGRLSGHHPRHDRAATRHGDSLSLRVGLPVSLDDAPMVGDVVEGQSHAWVEYFSGSWTGIDPTNGVRETERHIIVGHGRDYDDVSPLKGIYHGPASTQLGVVVEMRRTH